MTHFEKLRSKLSDVSDLKYIQSLMSWDMEVMMPPGGAQGRARQLGTLSGLFHKMYTGEVPALLEAVEQHELDQLDAVNQSNVREIRRELDRMIKIPEAHVKAFSQLTSEAQQAWVQARKNDDFNQFAPYLEKIVEMQIQQTEYVGYDDNPYDALMEEYEPGMKAKDLVPLFSNIVSELKPILEKIRQAPQVDDSFLKGTVSSASQLKWSESILKKLGYDFNRGRQDLSAHPFSINFGSDDVRITTVVNENDIGAMLFSSIHECGHALYEMGIPGSQYGLPSGEYCSLSIHESQSRLWENNIARELPFWEHLQPSFSALFSDQLAGKGPEAIFRAVNKVEPSLIRIYSDELHYHMHIALRFEIENELINRRVKVRELPDLWRSRIKEYFGLEVPSDAQGVLQDIHWSHGSIGYFPTYSLGSFFAAQFMNEARKALPDLDAQQRAGNFAPLLDWLRQHIHQFGRTYPSNSLCERITGERLNVSHFINYAKDKFGRVYGIDLS